MPLKFFFTCFILVLNVTFSYAQNIVTLCCRDTNCIDYDSVSYYIKGDTLFRKRYYTNYWQGMLDPVFPQDSITQHSVFQIREDGYYFLHKNGGAEDEKIFSFDKSDTIKRSFSFSDIGIGKITMDKRSYSTPLSQSRSTYFLGDTVIGGIYCLRFLEKIDSHEHDRIKMVVLTTFFINPINFLPIQIDYLRLINRPHNGILMEEKEYYTISICDCP